MKCIKDGCAGKLRVSHTFAVGSSKYQRAVCSGCGMVHTLTTVASPGEGRGNGAKARAKQASKGPS